LVTQQSSDASFSDLGLASQLLDNLIRQGYASPTPIQKQSIPVVLQGTDVMGLAQTGTGKTAAFSLPILQHLMAKRGGPGPRCLVLAPTRELAIQIGDNVRLYGAGLGIRAHVIFGGVSANPQIDALRRGVDFLVATPGRLLDLMGQGAVSLSAVTHLVLDEADRMLDMGFIHDLKKILKHVPSKRQTLMFSATMSPAVQELAHGYLTRPVTVEVAKRATAASLVTQEVIHCDAKEKVSLLVDLVRSRRVERGIIFVRMKHRANRIVETLEKQGLPAAAFHSNKSQNARQRALNGFKKGEIRLLVATDIAARGIDVDEVSHVINFELPNEPESYVHRIGRTGRAGMSGHAISLCAAEERSYLVAIERLIRQKIPVVE
jgi:ATP-dependent RNA helicase RhlE